MTKEEFIKTLPNVKLVLGNGADLYCGLKTKYSDFFEYNRNYYLNIRRSFEDFKRLCDTESNPNKLLFSLECDFSYNPSLVKNIWDVLFSLSFEGNENDVLWCDIESKMHDSFIKKNAVNEPRAFLSSVHWDEVNELVHNYKHSSRATSQELFVAMISNIICNNKHNDRYYNFNVFLKEQLVLFEHLFGLFIENKTAYNPILEQKQKDLLNLLADTNKIVSIDTFNYSDFYGSPKGIFPKHINGSYKSPIFGIDRSFQEYDGNALSSEALNYLKTSRRMDLELINGNVVKQEEYENVIVFGHSLNKQDYSYFYPLLDKIRISDTTSSSHFVIAYHIYDESKADEIRLGIKKAVSDLFNAYEKEHLGSRDARLLDFLTTQDRVILYQI